MMRRAEEGGGGEGEGKATEEMVVRLLRCFIPILR